MARHDVYREWSLYGANHDCRVSSVSTETPSELALLVDRRDIDTLDVRPDGTVEIIVHRGFARMLARRIEQCLEATR